MKTLDKKTNYIISAVVAGRVVASLVFMDSARAAYTKPLAILPRSAIYASSPLP